jgi:hypothetical protein
LVSGRGSIARRALRISGNEPRERRRLPAPPREGPGRLRWPPQNSGKEPSRREADSLRTPPTRPRPGGSAGLRSSPNNQVTMREERENS